MRRIAVPELFLGLLSIGLAVVITAKIAAGAIHDARHVRDTITITGSARKPIASNLVQWSLTVSGDAATPVEAARRLRRESSATVTFLRRAGIAHAAIAPEVVQTETI